MVVQLKKSKPRMKPKKLKLPHYRNLEEFSRGKQASAKVSKLTSACNDKSKHFVSFQSFIFFSINCKQPNLFYVILPFCRKSEFIYISTSAYVLSNIWHVAIDPSLDSIIILGMHVLFASMRMSVGEEIQLSCVNFVNIRASTLSQCPDKPRPVSDIWRGLDSLHSHSKLWPFFR